MAISLSTQITGTTKDLDEDAREKVEVISKTLVRKDDEMEVARTEFGSIFLDTYYMILKQNGLQDIYEPTIVRPSKNNKNYRLILKRI